MAMGTPIICNSHVGDTDFIVNKYQSGFVVKDVFAKDFSQDVTAFLNQTYDTEKIISGAKDYFSLENGVQKYAAVYAAVLGK